MADFGCVGKSLSVQEPGKLQFSLSSLLYVITAVSLLLGASNYLGGSGLVVGLPIVGAFYWVCRRRSVASVILLCLVGRWGYGILQQALATAHFVEKGVTLATDDDAPLVIANVERLEGANLRLSDEDLAWLSFVPTTTAVWLDGSRVTDAGMVHLQSLPKIRWLDLAGTRVTDAGMAEIGRLETLEQLCLADTAVTDEGLRHLIGLDQLSWLRLDGTSVTDKGLAELYQLTKLTWIDLTGTRVSDEGIRRLRRALPAIRISRRE